jgi:prolyl-tRNA editing enzyme YbaK/EbsC (Cys-tRNA(Pro) deacylase)
MSKYAMSETLQFHIAMGRPDLVAPSVTVLLQSWQGLVPVEDIWVAEIDPAAAGGKDFCERYGVPFDAGANCVIVEATRNENRTFAACLALVNYQMNFNGIIRKTLNARRVSLAPLPHVLQETEMEYGSITPFGLPSHWPILLDAQVIQVPRIVIGSGLIKSKLSLPGKVLAELPGAIVIEGLASKLAEG